MPSPSDIESCNEKTIIDKVIEHIDDLVEKTSLTMLSYFTVRKQQRDIKNMTGFPVVSYLLFLKTISMAIMSALVYYIIIMVILKQIEKNKSSLDTLLIIVPIYVNYIITTVNLYLRNINSIKKNLIIFKIFLNTHPKIKDGAKEDSCCIKELLELFLHELIEFEKEIKPFNIAYTISCFNPPKCHPLIEDITSFKDDLKYSLDKD